MKIPKRFKLFSTTVKVVFDNKRMDDIHAYGYYEESESKIILCKVDGVSKLPDDKILDTFYHERTHAILQAMNKKELSANEEFVDVFSKLLRQAIESEKY